MGLTTRNKINEAMGYWLQVVWNRRPRVILRMQRMLMLNAYKCHITLNVIHAVSTDLVVIPGGMTSHYMLQ
jgi:hypothetical protein